MLHIHFSNRLEPLRDLLLQRLHAGAAGVFETEPVIVPSAAMRRWLSLAIADARGICADEHFAFLASWLWQQIARGVPGVADTSPLATPPLTWRVHRAFCDAGFVERHPRLAGYLSQADAVMRYELADRVAALLELYVTYRPAWLQAWRQGRAADLGTGTGRAADLGHGTGRAADLGLPSGDAARRDEAWQATLWQRIDAELGMQAQHPAQSFIDALRRGGSALAQRAGLPATLHVFALPGMPPLHMQLLLQLSAWVEVQLYVLNPCREYWFELIDTRRLSHLAVRGRSLGHEVGNRLLAGWGRQAQLQIEATLSMADALGEGAEDDASFEPAAGNSLLATLQNALLDLHELAPGSVNLADGDRSIEVHVCHSLTRELEVLQDHLLGLFAAMPGLQPGDILVVTPDLDSAAPSIDALFGTAPKERFIPYAIGARSRSGASPAARTLLALLSLAASRCTATDVFALLQLPPVARRFGLDDAALVQVHGWLREAGFHWALDARHLAGFDVPTLPRHTLDDALQRLFLGYALPEQAIEPFAGLLGAGNAEGSRAIALGAFWRFAGALQRLHLELQVPKLPASWAQALFAALDEFLLVSDDGLDDLHELQAAIGQLADDMRAGDVVAALPLEVVHAALAQQLDAAAAGSVAGGGLNFASMSSLRCLPFKVVCAIGMNDGAFPGTQRPLEFDLMALHPQRGDRQRRDDERGLMLDLLLAARHSLYFSHTGRSVRDNAVLPPSVLVAELLDVLVPAIADDPASSASLALARQRLVVEHALQPFAAECFAVGGDVRKRSFNRELAEALRGSLEVPAASWAAAGAIDGDGDGDGDGDSDGEGEAEGHEEGRDEGDGDADDDADAAAAEHARSAAAEALQPFFRTPLPPPDAAWRQVSLAQLVEFFRNPCRALLRRRLGIELAREVDELQDDEPFLGDARARGALARRLLPALLDGADEPAVMQLAHAGTEMPEGSIGSRQLQRELQALRRFADVLRDAVAEPCLPPHAALLDIEVDAEAWSLQAAFADLRPLGLLRWRYGASRVGDYLEAWLQHLALCADTPAGASPRTRWLSSDGEFSFTPCADALSQLRALLGLYRRGLRAPLHFFPRSAWQFVQHGRSQALAAWASTQEPMFGEGRDPAYQLALRGIQDPLDETFEALAAAVFAPLCAHLIDARLKNDDA